MKGDAVWERDAAWLEVIWGAPLFCDVCDESVHDVSPDAGCENCAPLRKMISEAAANYD